MNFYIYGKGGTGKGFLSRAIARAMYPQYEYDDEIFFGNRRKNEIGWIRWTSVIIWNDVRRQAMRSLGGAETYLMYF